MEFKRGIIRKAEYHETFDYPVQELYIEELDDTTPEKTFHNVVWAIEKDTDLYGVNDKVSFLLNHSEIIKMRLNNF